MNKISISDVQHLAKLSNLTLSESEIDRLGSDLDKILNYIEKLKELNTDGVEPTYQVTELQNIYRQDEITETDIKRENLLDLAPESDGESIKVPKVM